MGVRPQIYNLSHLFNSSVKGYFEFFPKSIAKVKNLITQIQNKITQIYRRRFNLCNLLLICVIRSFPLNNVEKQEFDKECIYLQEVTSNSCDKFGKASYFGVLRSDPHNSPIIPINHKP